MQQLEDRTVAVHDQRFSPCNNHVRIKSPHEPGGRDCASFTSVVICADGRACVTSHCIPTQPAGPVERCVQEKILAAKTVEELLGGLNEAGPAGALVKHHLNAFLDK